MSANLTIERGSVGSNVSSSVKALTVLPLLLAAPNPILAQDFADGGRCIPLAKVLAIPADATSTALSDADRKRLDFARRTLPQTTDLDGAVVVGPSLANAELTILLSKQVCEDWCLGWFLQSRMSKIQITTFRYKSDMYAYRIYRDRSGKPSYNRFLDLYVFRSLSDEGVVVAGRVSRNSADRSELGKVVLDGKVKNVITGDSVVKRRAYQCIDGEL